jgi:hypothetical protein
MTWIDPFGKEHRYGPPVGWKPPQRETFSVDAEWAAICARGLEFPDYRGLTSLRGVRGDCLYPLVTDQQMLKVRRVAPDEELVSGRLYCVQWTNEVEAQIYRDKIGIESKEPIVIAKFLYFTAFEWWCICKESMTKLGNSIVVGEVVGVVATAAALFAAGCAPEATVHARMPCNNPFDAGSAVCSAVGANAVSTIGSANSATAVTSSGAIHVNTNTTIISLTVTTTGQPVEVDGSFTAQVLSSGNGSLTVCNAKIFRDGSAVAGAEWDPTNGGGNSLSFSTMPQSQQVTLVVTDAPAAGSHTYSIVMNTTYTNAGSGLGELQATNNFIKVREIKR